MESKLFLKYKQQCPFTDQAVYVNVETNKTYTITEWTPLEDQINKEILEKIRQMGVERSYKLELDTSNFYVDLLQKGYGKITAINDSAVLWESFWEYDGEKIKRKPFDMIDGSSTDWHIFDSMNDAYSSIKNDLLAVQKLVL